METSSDNLCRLCLKLSEETVNLFHYKNGFLVADLVKLICPIEITRDEGDKLPDNVCLECLELILDAIHLRDLSVINDEELRRNLQTENIFEVMKLEEEEDEIYIEALDEAALDEEIQVEYITTVVKPITAPTKNPVSTEIRCEICDATFCNVSSIKRHMQRKHRTISYACDLCDGVFRIKLDLKKHMSKKHVKKYPDVEFTVESSSGKHIIYDINDMFETLDEPCGLSCCFCTYIDYDEDSLNLHLASHQSVVDTGKMYCVHCPSPILSMEHMIEHARIHNEKLKTHRCLVCFKLFPFDDKFFSHLRNHKKNQNNICYCSECGRKFSKHRMLEDHIRFIHNKESLFCCPRCGQGFGSKSALNGHIRRHNDGNKFECPFCPKTFSSHNLLNSHKIVHSNDRVRNESSDGQFDIFFSCSHSLVRCAISDSNIRRFWVTTWSATTESIQPTYVWSAIKRWTGNLNFYFPFIFMKNLFLVRLL